ncbi:hypothetical protein GCM10022222_58820 [Amycolatopsis ultiminotia]|uniref:Polyketide cyclase / dehydrase and lipid transport n=1 Tax=Amycolatopsis ultiminotia TaxID=543629 RepID=A0ABP6XHE3_9PSEU
MTTRRSDWGPATMPHITETITIPASADAVFALVSDITNLPEWVEEFTAVSPDGDGWRADTVHGAVRLTVTVDKPSRVVDFRVDSPFGVHEAFTRVLPAGDEAEFLYTRLVKTADEARAETLRTTAGTRLQTLLDLVGAAAGG